jgi:hypothetical protein
LYPGDRTKSREKQGRDNYLSFKRLILQVFHLQRSQDIVSAAKSATPEELKILSQQVLKNPKDQELDIR